MAFAASGTMIGATATVVRNYNLNRGANYGVLKSITKRGGEAALRGAIRGTASGLLLL